MNMYSGRYYTGTDINVFQEKYVPTSNSEHITVFYSMEYYVLLLFSKMMTFGKRKDWS